MTIKHTQGPWAFHLDDDSTKISAYFTAKNCNSQFITETPETNYSGNDIDRVRANAKLIAAAPDLYAELRRVQVELMGWEESDQVSFGIAADMLTRLQSIQSILNKVTL